MRTSHIALSSPTASTARYFNSLGVCKCFVTCEHEAGLYDLHRSLPTPNTLWSHQKLFSHSHLDEFFSILQFMNCQPFYVVCILPSAGNCTLIKTICVSTQCGIAACVVYVFSRGKRANWSVAFLFLITFLFPSQASLFYILTRVPLEGGFNRLTKWTGMFKNNPKFCNETCSERTQLL